MFLVLAPIDYTESRMPTTASILLNTFHAYGTYSEASRFMLSFEKEREVFFFQKLMEADTGTDKHYKIKSFTLSCKYVNIMTVRSLDKELHL